MQSSVRKRKRWVLFFNGFKPSGELVKIFLLLQVLTLRFFTHSPKITETQMIFLVLERWVGFKRLKERLRDLEMYEKRKLRSQKMEFIGVVKGDGEWGVYIGLWGSKVMGMWFKRDPKRARTSTTRASFVPVTKQTPIQNSNLTLKRFSKSLPTFEI